MANPNHHVAIHGHFYQPPRDNPWLGVIEPQPSARPYRDWNECVTAQCYAPLTRSRLWDTEGRITDLYNCFAHISFDLGPTLDAWLREHHPELLLRVQVGDRLHAAARGGHGGALAHPFYHLILPLADACDRRLQIAWGLRAFARRFGRPARGMWLPECAVDMHTVRALIDHGVRFVVLSPFQVSCVRPLGGQEWRDVSRGGPDPRCAYRLFETDGDGRTHSDRYLDIFFFDRELSAKVSFDHLLSRPTDFARAVFSRFDADASLPQLVLLATDGEVYGHHEPGGEETLAAFLAATCAEQGVYLSNLEQYLAENPPAWEVRLWCGPDGRGSSWSCEHGVGRWLRDCGCRAGGHYRWNQAWRAPLRAALDELRVEARAVFEREGGKVFVDPWAALEDYVDVLLDPESRDGFLARHQCRALHRKERVLAWELLELCRYTAMMYTSCGWFFADLGGIETVQNLAYALRAAELAQPHTATDLRARLCARLAEARSNAEAGVTGADILRRDVMSIRYGHREIAAAHVLCELLGLQPSPCAFRVETGGGVVEEHGAGGRLCRGDLLVTDTRTERTHEYAFCAIMLPGENAGVLLAPPAGEGAAHPFADLGLEQARERLLSDSSSGVVRLRRLPLADRERVLAHVLRRGRGDLDAALKAARDRAVPLLTAMAGNGVPPDPLLELHARHHLNGRLLELARGVAAKSRAGRRDCREARAIREEAVAMRLSLDGFEAGCVLAAALRAGIASLADEFPLQTLERLLSLAEFCAAADLDALGRYRVQEAFWEFLHGPGPGVLQETSANSRPGLLAGLRELGGRLGYAREVLKVLGGREDGEE